MTITPTAAPPLGPSLNEALAKKLNATLAALLQTDPHLQAVGLTLVWASRSPELPAGVCIGRNGMTISEVTDLQRQMLVSLQDLHERQIASVLDYDRQYQELAEKLKTVSAGAQGTEDTRDGQSGSAISTGNTAHG